MTGRWASRLPGRRETKTADQAGREVRHDVSVEIRHDENLVSVGRRVGDHLQAGIVKELGVELDGGEVPADLLRGVEEEAVRHLHDGGLVHGAHLALAHLLGVLEGKAEHALGSGAGDELDALHHAVHDHMLDAGVFALGVLADEHGVDVVVGGLVAGDGFAGTDVGEEVEGSAEGEVEGYVTLSDRCLHPCQSVAGWELRKARLTARGPFKAIKFFLTLSIASSGITVRPSFNCGVTSTGSHSIGA